MAVRFKTTVQKEETVLTTETESSDSSASAEKTFTAEKIPAIVHLFKMADVDKSGGLDMDEFYGVMKEINPDIIEEEACVLHMKIDTNCDRTVDLGELLHYLLQRNEQAEALDYKNLLFPYGFTYKDGDSWNKIVKMICRPTKNITAPDFRDYCPMEPVRSYKDYTYISITSNGKLKFWSNDLEVSDTFSLQDRGMVTLPFHNPPKMQVNDMIYISDLMLLAVSTTDREVLFYNCMEFADLTKIKYCIIEEVITAMEYYRAGNKGILAFGDSRGYLYVFVSYYVRINGLFCKRKLRSIRGKHYPIVTISSLLKKTSTDFDSLKMFVFDDICTQVQYLPSLHFFTVCGETSKSMALIECIFDQEKKMPDVNVQIFTSPEDHRYYRCVAYSHNSKYFLTGGLAGVLRVWFPHKTRSCERELHGHKETVSHIIYNPIEKLFLSMSTDKKICIWVDGEWICKQTIYPSDLPSTAPISSVCYNIHNNELYVANKNIAKCFGRGTNAFHETLKSHEHPLSSMIYHSIYKQVVSVCQKGIVTVWDILSGKAVMQFDISQNKYAGQTFISFDEVNRKLITVSQNRMVQQWNFNNGEMLDVLPEKIPNDVTSIICINDEMFVSAKDCPDILQLDSKGQLKNVLNHFLLDDICSMDYHEDRLITASTNGNVLTWDLETLQVWDYIKTTDKPQVHRVEIYLRQQSFQQDFQPESITRENEKESPLIVKCLRTRSVGPKRATLLITRDTHITAWSTTINGGLISRFKVVKDDDAEITCIFLSQTETTLLTGDSNGVVCLYDIQDFGIQSKDDKMEYETVNGCKLPLQSPPLLASWQAAHSTLVSVACDPACEKVITGELQYNVKLWTNTGTLVGTFGKDRWMNMVQKHHIPPLETTNFGIPGLVRQELKKKKADLGPGNALKLMTDGNCFVSLLHLFKCQPEKKVLIQSLSEEPTPPEIIWNRTLKALNRIEQELKFVKKIKQNSAERHISALEKLIAHWIEDEKENFELSTDEVLEQSESVETQHSMINAVETTESTEAEETSEKEDSSTCFGKCENTTINLPKNVEKLQLPDEVRIQLKPSWLVNPYPNDLTEPSTDVTTTKSLTEMFTEKEINLVKSPTRVIEEQPTQPLLEPHPPKVLASLNETTPEKSQSNSNAETDSTSEALETPDIVLPLPENSKKFRRTRKQLKLLQDEITAHFTGPGEQIDSESQESTNETQQVSDYSAKRRSPITVATKEILSPQTTKETPVSSKEHSSPGASLWSPCSEKRAGPEGWTMLHDDIQQPELDLQLPPGSKVVRFKETQFTKPCASTTITVPVKSALRENVTVEEKPRKERDAVLALKTIVKKHSLNVVPKGPLKPTQQPSESKFSEEYDQHSTSALKTFEGHVSQCSPHTPATKKSIVSSADQKQPKEQLQLAMPSTSERIPDTKRDLTKVQYVTMQPKDQTVPTTKTSHATSLTPKSKKDPPVQTQWEAHPPMNAAGPTRSVRNSKTHIGARGHTHETEKNIQPAPLKKMMPPQSEHKPHPPTTPAGPTRPAGSLGTHRYARGHTHEKETNVQPAPSQKVKPPPRTPAGPTRVVESSTTHVATRGHEHERKTTLKVLLPISRKVTPQRTQQKPHPPMTPASPTREEEGSTTHICTSGLTHLRKTSLQVLPPMSRKVPPQQTQHKPHPPTTPRVVESSTTHISKREHEHERKTTLKELPPISKKVPPQQTQHKPHPPTTPRVVESSTTHISTREHEHERKTTLKVLPPISRKVPPQQTQHKPHPPTTPASPTREEEGSTTHRCTSGHTHLRKTSLRVLPPISRKVPAQQTQHKPHPPTTPASPTRVVESLGTDRCTTGNTHEIETNIQSSPPPLTIEQPPKNKQEPHPPRMPAGPITTRGQIKTEGKMKSILKDGEDKETQSKEELTVFDYYAKQWAITHEEIEKGIRFASTLETVYVFDRIEEEWESMQS